MQMSERRFCHVVGVEETAVVAAKYGADEAEASIAALTYYAKERQTMNSG